MATRLSIPALWVLCGVLGGALSGIGLALILSRGALFVDRLFGALKQALALSLVFGVAGFFFLRFSYFAMSAVYLLPSAFHHLALGWIVSGLVTGLWIGSVSAWIRRGKGRSGV